MRAFRSVEPTPAEVAAVLPGDDLIAADVSMDRGFDLPAPPEEVWPWLAQVGKRRGGWYFPASVERFVPAARRGRRRIDADLQDLEVGDTMADWGGRDATLTVAMIEPPRVVVHRSQRGRTSLTWTLVLTPAAGGTRMHSRVRIGPVRRRWLAENVGGLFDEATIAGLAAGLRERLEAR